MKTFCVRLVSIFLLLLLATPLVMTKGCGTPEVGVAQCPSGSYVANSTDVLTAPPDASLEIAPVYSGGSVIYAPVVFMVKTKDGVPRNNICVIFYSDGYFYTDDVYSTVLPGVGPMTRIAKVTDVNGELVLYWSTEILPPTGGADQKGDSWVTGYSGIHRDVYEVTWLVKTATELAIVTASPLPDAQVGIAYSALISAVSGTTPYAWSAIGLPAGLSIDAASGIISGTPAGAAASYWVIVTVTDSATTPASDSEGFWLTVNP
jgi:hypothetical protein